MSQEFEPSVYEERVVCENCKYHYAFLFESSEELREGRLGPVATRLETTEIEKEALRRLHLYAHPREVWHPCPHCGYVQSWMVAVVRRLKNRDSRITAAVLAAPLVAYFAARAAFAAGQPAAAAEAALHAVLVLGVYAVLAGTALFVYRRYLHDRWTPNRDVDCSTYEAVRAVDVDPSRSEVARSAYIAAIRKAPHAGRRATDPPAMRLRKGGFSARAHVRVNG